MTALRLLLLISVTLLIEKCRAASVIYYLDDYEDVYHNVLKLNSLASSSSSLRLGASRKSYPNNGSYAVTVEAPIFERDDILFVNVPKFSLRQTATQCIDLIKFHIGDEIYSGCYSNVNIAFNTTRNKIFVELQLGKTMARLNLFEIVVTVARKCIITGYDEFRCWGGYLNNYCINKALKCDREINCLDGSDESSCDSVNNDKGSDNTATKVTVPVGTIVFVTVVVLIWCWLKGCCRCKSEKVEETTVYVTESRREVVPPPTNTTINVIALEVTPDPEPPTRPHPEPYSPHSNQNPPPPDHYEPPPSYYPPQPSPSCPQPPPYEKY